MMANAAVSLRRLVVFPFLLFADTSTTEIYTLSLHDALPIYPLWKATTLSVGAASCAMVVGAAFAALSGTARSILLALAGDRKSTRLNSSHSQISYAVFCLKKKISVLSAWPRGLLGANPAVSL